MIKYKFITEHLIIAYSYIYRNNELTNSTNMVLFYLLFCVFVFFSLQEHLKVKMEVASKTMFPKSVYSAHKRLKV